MTLRPLIRLLLVGLACLPAPAAAPDPDPVREPWTVGPLLAAPAEVARAATLHDAGDASVLVLHDDVRLALDGRGAARLSRHLVYVIRHEEALASWARFDWGWSPWYQDRPVIRARVIDPDGGEHRLDPASLGEYGGGESGPVVYDDRKVLRGPLPGVTAGSVVEVHVVATDREPFFAAGIVARAFLRDDVPTARARIVLEFPAASEFRWKFRGVPEIEPVREEVDGLVRLTFERGPSKAAEEHEPFSPEESDTTPRVTVSTGRSWGEVARAFHEIVERQVAGADVKALVRVATRGARTREAKIAAVVAALHREVRYTGVEFGEAAIVPRPPAETLARKFGDCKDKSALLVAMLRAAGEEAHLALLSVGEGPDVDPELPGLGEFDHAVVHIPGATPLWIDATAEFVKVGQMPERTQARWALVAAPGTQALVRTPEFVPGANHVLEVREFRLAETGPGTVTEINHPTGLFEAAYRSRRAGSPDKELRENWTAYVAGTYQAKALDGFTSSDPRDLDRPFTLELRASGVGIAATGRDDAAVGVNVTAMLGDFAQLVFASNDAARLAADSDELPPRRADLVIHFPYSNEWRWKVVPAPGFVPKTLPEDRTVELGAATFSRRFTAGPDGTVEATFRLDVPRRRWTAAEVNAARKAMLDLEAEGNLLLAFDQKGEVLLASGRIAEALEAFRDVARKSPDRALPRMRASRALLAAGLGEAAVRESREAIRLEPGSARAHAALGWALQHDATGLRFGHGWDRAASIAAYRKATELDPSDVEVGIDLAIVLEHDASGERYSSRADLDAAIEEYRRLKRVGEHEMLDGNLVVALGRAGRFGEVRDFARTLPAGDSRNAWLLAAVAAEDGVQAALARATSVVAAADARRQALRDAGGILLLARRYAASAALMVEGSAGASDAVRARGLAELVRKSVRIEDAPIDATTPAGVARRFVIDGFTGDADVENMLRWFVPDVRESVRGETTLKGLQQALGVAVRPLVRAGIPLQVAADLAASTIEVSVEGDEKGGWRAKMRAPAESGERRLEVYLTSTPEGPRVAAMSRAEAWLSIEVVRRIEAGDLEGAGRWLDWARETVVPIGGDDPMREAPFVRLWSRGAPRDPARMRLAAAALGVEERETAARSAGVLESARAGFADDSLDAHAIDAARMWALRYARRWKDLAAIASTLLDRYPDSDWVFGAYASALESDRDAAGLRALVARRAETHPDDRLALFASISASRLEGRLDEMEAKLEQLSRRADAEPDDFNNLAWARLVRGVVDDVTLEFAQRAVRGSSEESSAALNTLAAVLAERGAIADAVAALRRGVESSRFGEPDDSDWYVLGRIAHKLGERESAIAAYRRVRKSEDDPWVEGSCWALAGKHLKALAPAR